MHADVSPSDPVIPGHTWLSYEGRDGFLAEAHRFVQAGAAEDARLLYASGRPLEQMRRDVAVLDPGGRMVADGTLLLLPYDETAEVVPDAQVAYFARETERALDDGLTGLHVLAELSGLAQGPQRGRLLRYEHLADRYMASHPMSSLCVVDRARVPHAAVAGLEAVHPHTSGASAVAGFRLLPEDDGLRLSGVVDAWDAEPLEEVLDAITARGTDLRLHMDELDFIGARGLGALARHGRRLAIHGGRLTVVGPRPVVRRACTVLDLDLEGTA